MLHSRVFTFNPLGTNCVVLWADGSSACVVADPGMSADEGERQLVDFLTDRGLVPEAIVLTHGHFDHVWGVERLLSRFDVPVYLHPADRFLLRDGASAIPGMMSLKSMCHDFPTVDVADGQSLQFACGVFKVLHTPGHSPGSVCYWIEADNLLLSGDTLFAGSIGRTDLSGGDYDALMASIREKLLALPGIADVIPGHGQPTTIAREGMYNPFLEPFNEDPLAEND